MYMLYSRSNIHALCVTEMKLLLYEADRDNYSTTKKPGDLHVYQYIIQVSAEHGSVHLMYKQLYNVVAGIILQDNCWINTSTWNISSVQLSTNPSGYIIFVHSCTNMQSAPNNVPALLPSLDICQHPSTSLQSTLHGGQGFFFQPAKLQHHEGSCTFPETAVHGKPYLQIHK